MAAITLLLLPILGLAVAAPGPALAPDGRTLLSKRECYDNEPTDSFCYVLPSARRKTLMWTMLPLSQCTCERTAPRRDSVACSPCGQRCPRLR
jgi:hypothetical protein